MQQLSKTPEGQQQLLAMWNSVHGCGNNVHTLITNKHTGECVLRDPEYYCSPEVPFKVEYDGIKVRIKMSTSSEQFLEVTMKTENSKSPILLFRHRS